MNRTLKIVFLVVTLATLVLGAGCNLKASTATTAKPTATSELNFITPTTGESISGQIATQTAEAGQPAVATETPVPATATAVPIAIPTLTRPATYTLQKGEWPICIARRYNLDLTSLFSANGLTMDSRPANGAVLKIPSTGTWSVASYGARALHTHADYKVVSGDTVYTIACYFGDVSPEGILAANSLKAAGDIKTGTTLKIP